MTSDIIICALLGAIIWNLLTGGSVCPPAPATPHAAFAARPWPPRTTTGASSSGQPDAQHWVQGKGLLWKVICPWLPRRCVSSGFLVMGSLYFLLRNARPFRVNRSLAAPNVQRRRDGLHARHQRRPKNHGHYRADTLRATKAGHLTTRLPGSPSSHTH